MQQRKLKGEAPCGFEPGDHPTNWGDFSARFGGRPHRNRLIANLKDLLAVLRGQGFAGAVYVGGSFITAKEEPGDVDIVLDCAGMPARKWRLFARLFLRSRDIWKSELGVDLYLSHPSFQRDIRDLFRYARGDDAERSGADGTRGLVVLNDEAERTKRTGFAARRQG
jgi:hypothetical protein